MKQKPSPVNVEKTLSGERKKASSKPRARTFSSSSDDSEESSSSSDEDTERNNSHAQVSAQKPVSDSSKVFLRFICMVFNFHLSMYP